ncbi:hypothetical protein CF392_10955 [Tamilnaduibacter salinus]|uniref:Uncharacterized protein n=1 Tax=Tamilnaduibacter salinus TaxID=1484056 RepID=A0A2A2I1A1_9GAMM|nr:hypothetical protein [Tamilnaduibacter salinus]PAV25427.1 hypothetical protein CF392_10955 [Tamilnaduibacter salinus]
MYQLVFEGECTPGTDRQTARSNAMALFKASIDQVDRMFSGQRVVIRNKLDEAQAEKYRAVLEKHGMVARVEAMGATAPPPARPAPSSEPSSPEPTPRPSEPPTAETASDRDDAVPVEPGDRLPVAGERVESILSGSSLRVDQAHERLTEAHEEEPPMFEHLDDWTIAPAGTTLTESREDIPPVVPDISHLSLVEQPDDESRDDV